MAGYVKLTQFQADYRNESGLYTTAGRNSKNENASEAAINRILRYLAVLKQNLKYLNTDGTAKGDSMTLFSSSILGAKHADELEALKKANTASAALFPLSPGYRGLNQSKFFVPNFSRLVLFVRF